MFKRNGAPLFLKRDLGSPLRGHQIDQVLERYCVLPLDSPPEYPQYNGSMERSMRDLHDALHHVRLTQLQLPISVHLELATHRLNHGPCAAWVTAPPARSTTTRPAANDYPGGRLSSFSSRIPQGNVAS